MIFNSRRDLLAYVLNLLYVISISIVFYKSIYERNRFIILLSLSSLIYFQLSFFRKKYVLNSNSIRIYNGITSRTLLYKNILNYERKSSKLYNPTSRYSLSKNGIEFLYIEDSKEESIFISPEREDVFFKKFSEYKKLRGDSLEI